MRQSKLVQAVRRISRMFTDGNIYWVHCLGNYLQLIVIVYPLVLFLFGLVFDIDEIICKTLNFCINIVVIWSLIISVVTVLLCLRCKKIKKNNSKYSKCELREWGGM